MRSSMDITLALRIAMPTLALACAMACSAGDDGRRDETGLPTDTDTETDTDTSDDTNPELSDVAWFTLEGHLALSGGEAVAGGSLIEVVFHPSEAESTNDTAMGVDPCKVAPGIQGLTPTAPSDEDATLYGWWRTSLEDPDLDACITELPANLHLGIGPLDPGLYPAMDTNGYDPYAGTLYGLYVQYGMAPTPPIWVFGITGTQANFDGTASVSGPPLPDGTYDLVSLHLLPFEAR